MSRSPYDLTWFGVTSGINVSVFEIGEPPSCFPSWIACEKLKNITIFQWPGLYRPRFRWSRNIYIKHLTGQHQYEEFSRSVSAITFLISGLNGSIRPFYCTKDSVENWKDTGVRAMRNFPNPNWNVISVRWVNSVPWIHPKFCPVCPSQWNFVLFVQIA